MIRSMTGFGRGEAEAEGVAATVEMRSVNKRFLETRVNLPRSLAQKEPDVEARVKDAFGRGRIKVQVQVESADEPAVPLQVDKEAARAYHRLLREVRDAAGLDDEPVRLEHLIEQSSDVLKPLDADDDLALSGWPAIERALDEAIEGLQAMRREEGEALHADLEERIGNLEDDLETAQRRAPERVEEHRAKLRERLAEMLDEDRLDEDRLETEMALLADKLDVSEECVRLDSHLNLFREALESDEPVGRKLNFITQEIHREVNTIGSKSNDPELAHCAVRMKEQVEKIREQIQNVE
jgi:uncharacterized protein (TIGR00255 family)